MVTHGLDAELRSVTSRFLSRAIRVLICLRNWFEDMLSGRTAGTRESCLATIAQLNHGTHKAVVLMSRMSSNEMSPCELMA